MSAFGDAFKKARKKFEKSGAAGDYVFEHNGKKYSILKKGETKKGVMKKFSAPAKSLKPKLRPRLDDLKDSGIKMSKLPPAGLKKKNMMDNPPPDLKRTAKLRKLAGADDFGTKTKVAESASKPKNGSSPKPIKSKDKDKVKKNKGGPVSKKPKGAYAAGGMPMVMKGGKKVPAFAADGVGKMNMGGMAAKKKKPAAKKMMAGGMAAKKKSPVAKKMMGGGMAKKSGYMYGGMAKKKMK